MLLLVGTQRKGTDAYQSVRLLIVIVTIIRIKCLQRYATRKQHITSYDFFLQVFVVTSFFRVVYGITVTMHLVNGISWRHIITAVISAAVLIRVGYSVFCIKQVGELHITFCLLAQSQHNVWTLHRGHGVSSTDG